MSKKSRRGKRLLRRSSPRNESKGREEKRGLRPFDDRKSEAEKKERVPKVVKTFFIPLIYLLLPLIFFRKVLLPSAMIFGTDFLAGGYMSRKFLIDYLREHRTIPFWNPYVYGGVPYVDALAGDLFYPISWILRFLLPAHTVPVYLFVIHIFFAGLFMYLFLKELGVSKLPSFLGGLSYQWTGTIVSLVYAGHDAKIIVSSLLPLLLLFIHRGFRLKNLIYFIFGGGVLGFIFLSPHIQMAYYSLIISSLFFLFLLIRHRERKEIPKFALFFVFMLIVGFSFAGIQYLPFYSYIPYSPRGGGEGRGIEFAKSWSMPPEETIDSLVPDFSGTLENYWGRNFFKLHSEYLGVFAILFAIISLVYFRRKSYILLFSGIVILGLLFAWGGYTPFFSIFYYILPYYKKLRAAGMAFFIVAFAVNILASFGLQRIIDMRKKEEDSRRIVFGITIVFGLLVVIGFMCMGWKEQILSSLSKMFVESSEKQSRLLSNYDTFVAGYFRMIGFLLVYVIVVTLFLRKTIIERTVGALSAILIVLDLWIIDSRFLNTVPPPEEYFRTDPIIEVLKRDSSLYRVLPLQYDKIGNYLLIFGIQNVGGEHGNQLQRYNEFLGAGKTSMVDYHNIYQYRSFLDVLNVKYLISYNALEDPSLELLLDAGFKIYRNKECLPRVFLVSSFEKISESEKILERMKEPSFNYKKSIILEESPGAFEDTSDIKGSVDIAQYEANRVLLNVEANRSCFLFFSDNFYPSWKAKIDGNFTKVYRTNYTFRSVVVPVGKHKVEFIFVPEMWRKGIWVSFMSALTLLLSILYWFAKLRNQGLKRRVKKSSLSHL